MVMRKGFSLYDIEEFLREAGAERVSEKAVLSLDRELKELVGEIIDEAKVYAEYAGRKTLIKTSDIKLSRRHSVVNTRFKRAIAENRKKASPRLPARRPEPLLQNNYIVVGNKHLKPVNSF
ncbi:MAG: hypothetical protein KGH98_01090 [Candidatus Micrarchaeota archaeon]|nr:hypothetical protein [Candidatus Micrarchaeota archaeon]